MPATLGVPFNHGGRALTELGGQMTNVHTANQVLGKARPGEPLRWCRAIGLMPDQGDIRKPVAHWLTQLRSPADEKDDLTVFMLGARLSLDRPHPCQPGSFLTRLMMVGSATILLAMDHHQSRHVDRAHRKDDDGHELSGYLPTGCA